MWMRYVMLLALVMVPMAHLQTSPSVVISEVMWMGSDFSTADEWVEFAGLGDSQTLSGWTLTRLKDGEEELIIQFGEGLHIGAGEFLVVSNYSAEESRLLNEPALSMPAMVLPNTKLLLRLRDSAGNLIDNADDGVGDPFAGSNTDPKSSMERISLTGSGGLKSNWQTAITSLGFDQGINLFGTPGSSNGIIQGEQEQETEQNNDTEIQIESFSKLKITELLSDPSGSDAEGEWIEIANTGSGTLNIGGLFLQVGEGGTFVFSEISLGSGEYLALGRPQTGVSLRNAGDIVRLLHGETLIDSIEYPELPEGVSYGRAGESLQLFCVSTKGSPNQVILLDPKIGIQSGETHALGKVTINLEATVGSGSLASATCSWDYSDGYTSTSCNPPSHTFRDVGTYDVHLSLTDYCINTVERTLEVEVLENGVYQEPSHDFGGGESGCVPDTSTGILIYDFLPNPEGKDAELEWIELKNRNAVSANLCGWVLDDAEEGSKSFGLDVYTVQPGQFLKIPITESKLTLNNDGDSVRLFFNGTLIQEITYGEISEGVSYKNVQNQDGGLPPPEGEDEGGGVSVFTGSIVINELYPAPLPDEEEWIEIFNHSNVPIDISELVLDDRIDAGSKPWTIPDGTILPPEGYIVFRKEETYLALNNNGDDVNLVNPEGTLIDTVTYPKLKRGLSFSRMGSRWCDTEISTPLYKNICPKNQFLSKILIEEKSVIEGIKSNSRSNNTINKLRTIYKHNLAPTFLLTPEVTSPFLAEVLAMAGDPGVMVRPAHHDIPRRTQDDTWEPLLLSLTSLWWSLVIFSGF